MRICKLKVPHRPLRLSRKTTHAMTFVGAARLLMAVSRVYGTLQHLIVRPLSISFFAFSSPREGGEWGRSTHQYMTGRSKLTDESAMTVPK